VSKNISKANQYQISLSIDILEILNPHERWDRYGGRDTFLKLAASIKIYYPASNHETASVQNYKRTAVLHIQIPIPER